MAIPFTLYNTIYQIMVPPKISGRGLYMLKHEIVNSKNNMRVIIVTANDLMRYQLLDINDKPLQFKREGSKAIAIVCGEIKVFRKPNTQEFHKQFMLHNARALWLGSRFNKTPAKHDRLIKNSLEYEGTI